ncbi:protein ANKUB1-like [Alosa pseudoharengus]|uniref:protein ANKUB1-like n=1 Tax=Alosa pseudoharengus TaxID=34774 RepID=UPI003F8B6324
MSIFISFEGSCERFHISHDETVSIIKQMVKNYFCMPHLDNQQWRYFLELSYSGAVLQDSWSLADVGISSGSTLRCELKEETKAIVYVYNSVTRETLSLMGTEIHLSSPVSRVRSLVSVRCSLPVSAFRLTTQSGTKLYDCNTLKDYVTEVGSTLRLKAWDGWGEFLKACFRGHKQTVQQYLSEERPVLRFQQRVALYIAASQGHLELASWLIERGEHAEQAVGVHPYREWCHETDHLEITKSPIHVAAETGQLLILKLFVRSSVLTLSCRDPLGRDPIQIALKNRHRKCVAHLVTKLWSVMSFPDLVIPMKIYIQIKSWIRRVQRKVINEGVGHGCIYRTRVGDTVLVDGFTLPKMSFNVSRGNSTRSWAPATSCVRPALTTDNSPSCPPHPPTSSTSQNASVRLPQLHPPTPSNRGEKKCIRKKGATRKGSKEILDPANSNQSGNTWKSRVPLPPVSRDVSPRPLFVYTSPDSAQLLSAPLESFSQHCGRTTRENAIYCLALASAFTEKPWLQQLSVARSLARRSMHKVL